MRRISPFPLPPGLLLLAVLSTSPASSTPTLYAGRCAGESPRIDGDLSDLCWQNAAGTRDFTVPGGTSATTKTVDARVAFDDTHLYLGVVCHEPDPASLRLRHRRDHPDVWQDDVIEIFLRAGDDYMAVDQLLVNAAGARWSLHRRSGDHLPWPPDWPGAAHIGTDRWTAEIAVPFADIGVGHLTAGRLIELKIGREDYTSGSMALSVWPAGAVYAGIDGYGHLFLGDANRLQGADWSVKAATRELELSGGGTVRTDIALRPAAHELTATVSGHGTLQVELGSLRVSRPVDGADTIRISFVAVGESTAVALQSGPSGDITVDSVSLRERSRLEAVGPAIPVYAGQVVRIEHVGVVDSRAVRGFIGTPFDGTVHSRGWNGAVWEYPQAGAGAGVGYAYGNNDGLHVRLAERGGFDAVQIRGGIRADLHAPALSYRGAGDSRPRHHFPGGALRSRALFGERIHEGDVSLTGVTDGVVADAAFFRIHRQAPFAEPAQRWSLGTVLTTTGVTGLDAIGLSFDIDGHEDEMTLIVDDPVDTRLRLLTVDIAAHGPGRTHVVLDIIDQLLPAKSQLSVRIEAEGAPPIDAEAQLYTTDVTSARREAFAYRSFLVKSLFACASEPRPWTSLPPADQMATWFATHPMGDQLQQLFAAVDHARWLDPENESMRQYWQWLWRRRRTPDAGEPVASSVHQAPEAPAWATWARAAWLAARGVPAWWFEHRLVETGEFGGAVGDDTDLYQNFVDLAFFEEDGVAAQFRDTAARLDHLAQLTTMVEGINRRTMDPLHAYEEGLNQEALMAVLEYGDPVYLERCMTAARSLADLTVVTAAGHRHFRSQRIGHDTRHVSDTDIDGQAHPQMWHPALELLWYNRNPQAERWLRQWADGWLEHFEPGRYAHAVDVASERVEGTNTRPLYGGYGGQGSAFAFLAVITGDRRYAAPFYDFYTSGRTDTSPGDLLLDFYHRFGHESFSGSLDDLYLRGPAAALLHGDLDALVTALRADVVELQTFSQMYTSAEPFTDRVFLNALRNAAITYTGGFATRNKISHSHAVGWSGLGTEYAALVEQAGPLRFRARLYSFGGGILHGAVRFWQLQHGRYLLRLGADADDDGRIDGAATERKLVIRRGERVAIDVAGGGSVLEVEPLEALEPVAVRADLALSPLDIVFADDTVSGYVHNIGSRPAEASLALVPTEGCEGQRLDLGVIEAPTDLHPRKLAFRLRNVSESCADGLLRVDVEDDVAEIFEGNNEVSLRRVRQVMRRQAEVEAELR